MAPASKADHPRRFVSMPRGPVVHAFLLSDDAVQDKASSKWSVFSVFGEIIADGFPVRVSRIAVFVRATFPEARHYRIDVDLAHAETADTIATIHGELEMNAPGKPWEAGMPMLYFPLPKPGIYQATLFIDDTPAAFVQFDATVKKAPDTSSATPSGKVRRS